MDRRELLKAGLVVILPAGKLAEFECDDQVCRGIGEGDTIVLKYPGSLKGGQAYAIVKAAEEKFPGVKCIILQRGMDIEVYSDKFTARKFDGKQT